MSSRWLVILRRFDPSFRQLSCNSKFWNEVKCKACNNLRCWHDFATQNVIISLINHCCSTEITGGSREDMDDSDPGPSESNKIVEYPDDGRGPLHGQHHSEQRRGVQKRRHTDRQSFRKLQRLVQSPEVQKMSREDRGGLQKLRDWKKPLLTLQIPSMRCLWTRRSKLPCSCQKVGLRLVSQH